MEHALNFSDMRRSFQFLFLLWIFVLPSSVLGQSTSSPSLEATLQQKYLNRVYVLRGFYQENGLHFDTDGLVRGHPHPGPWTLAVIAVKKIKISNGKVQLDGLRFAEIYDLKQAKLVLIPANTPIKIDIDRDPSQPDSKVIAAISHIFIQPEDHLGELVPDFWKPYVSGEVENVPQDKGDDCFRIRDQFSRTADGKITRGCEEHAKVKATGTESVTLNPLSLPYLGGKQVKAPQVISAPDPSYGKLAYAASYEATTIFMATVTPQGTISDLFIVRPAGLDLDDQAALAINKWRFKPGMLGGQAVSVRISIMVDFKE